MPSRKPRKSKIPDFVQDLQSKPDKYNEPALRRKPDQMPAGNVLLSSSEKRLSPAAMRLKIEDLLQLKCASPNQDQWRALGAEATPLLFKMLGDPALREELRQRVILALGQMRIPSAVGPLGQILSNESQNAVSRASAAISLGAIGDAAAVEVLGQAAAQKENFVRRQVARALGQLRIREAVPYLLCLTADRAPDVARAAQEAVRECAAELKIDLDLKSVSGAVTKPSSSAYQKKRKPTPE